MYRSLNPDAIVSTIERLQHRIQERFPESGLAQVAEELLQVGREATGRLEEIRRPHLPLRVGVALLIVLIFTLLVGTVASFEFSADGLRLNDVVELADAALNELVLLGAVILFLVTLERRWRRSQALRSIDELRSLAHVVDMHQLTKDPVQMLSGSGPAPNTPSSPTRNLTPFQISRYLDYCSEMFSLIGKVAALFVQNVDDEAVLASVNDVDQLTTGLSRKVWQKIVILQSIDSGQTPIVTAATPTSEAEAADSPTPEPASTSSLD